MIPNGVDVAAFQPQADAVLRDGGPLRLGFVDRIEDPTAETVLDKLKSLGD